MDRNEFCNSVKEKFPELSNRTDRELELRWGEEDPEYYSYTWFEALANVINTDMLREVNSSKYGELFCVINHAFSLGDESVKTCIDVAFIENLFWQVPTEKAEPYWSVLPEKLRELYIGFHHKHPL